MLLLIDVEGVLELTLVVLASTIAMLIFAALTMNWFRVKSRWWENVLLALAVALLFRPDFFMGFIAEEYTHVPAKQVYDVARGPADEGRWSGDQGQSIEGTTSARPFAVRLGPKGEDGRKRLAEPAYAFAAGENVQVSGVKLGSRARKGGFEQGFDVDRSRCDRAGRRRTGSTCRPPCHCDRVVVPGAASECGPSPFPARRADQPSA